MVNKVASENASTPIQKIRARQRQKQANAEKRANDRAQALLSAQQERQNAIPPTSAQQRKAQVDIARSLLAPDQLVIEIQKIHTILMHGYMPVYACPPDGVSLNQYRNTDYHKPVISWRQLTKEDYGRLNLQLKNLTLQLGKCLPDLKSIELNDVSDNAQRMSEADLAQRLSSIISAPAPKRPGQLSAAYGGYSAPPPLGGTADMVDQPEPPLPGEKKPSWLN